MVNIAAELGVLVIATASSMILFFVLVYPDIQAQKYTSTMCHVIKARIDSSYCCTKVCSSCETAFIGTPRCETRIKTLEGIDPAVCWHPSCLGSMTCSAGHICCTYACDTCYDCETVNGRKICGPPTPCNCGCRKYTDELKCTITCDLCYTVKLTYEYTVGNHTESITRNYEFERDLKKADAFVEEMAGMTRFCWYNPKDSSKVRFSIDHAIWKWLVTWLFGWLPMLVGIAMLTNKVLQERAPDWVFTNVVLWVGVAPCVCFVLLAIQLFSIVCFSVACMFFVGVCVSFCSREKILVAIAVDPKDYRPL
jgi:hypothetical protein